MIAPIVAIRALSPDTAGEPRGEAATEWQIRGHANSAPLVGDLPPIEFESPGMGAWLTKEGLLDRLGCDAAMGGGSLKSQIATLEEEYPRVLRRRATTRTGPAAGPAT
jgi:hypothetical protein